jgi:Flp pilus assembly pilin Flp
VEETDMLRRFFNREEGKGLVEFVISMVVIALVLIAIITVLSRQPEQRLQR